MRNLMSWARQDTKRRKVIKKILTVVIGLAFLQSAQIFYVEDEIKKFERGTR